MAYVSIDISKTDGLLILVHI